MSVYGDLSKAQRALLWILQERAVSMDTAMCIRGKQLQTARNLERRGLVATHSRWISWEAYAWLTPSGVDLLRSLDFRHVGGSRRSARAKSRVDR